ncbi:hypothetical protein Ancab_028184 [Ancistrocladus abbreviatus]
MLLKKAGNRDGVIVRRRDSVSRHLLKYLVVVLQRKEMERAWSKKHTPSRLFSSLLLVIPLTFPPSSKPEFNGTYMPSSFSSSLCPEVRRYGPVFRTHLAGKPVIVSVDPDFNRYIFQQEGKLVEIWYMDSISKLFAHDGEARTNQAGYVHKYIRINFNHFGLESLREKLLPLMEDSIDTTLFAWCAEESIEVKKAVLSVHL